MDFGTDSDLGKKADDGPKAWKDIWSAGQGVGAVKQVQPAAERIAQLAREYQAAKQLLIDG